MVGVPYRQGWWLESLRCLCKLGSPLDKHWHDDVCRFVGVMFLEDSWAGGVGKEDVDHAWLKGVEGVLKVLVVEGYFGVFSFHVFEGYLVLVFSDFLGFGRDQGPVGFVLCFGG